MEARKLKYDYQRRTKDVVHFTEFCKEISRETGFLEKDIKLVWKVGLGLIVKYMFINRSILLPKIGLLFPAIKTARQVTNLKGGVGEPTKMIMPARWVMKFKPGNHVSRELLKKKPTEEEINNLYI